MKPLHDLGAAEALGLLRRGAVTAEALVRGCLARIATEEPRIGAWEHLDPERALEQARRIDALGAARPPLAGLPVGVKDIIDTADLPTERGSPIHRGRRPAADAACVAALRAAGGVVLGKTVTTEFAFLAPGKTRNPFDAARTPGGSSSGSAAAVAARMVPVALGTQTAGSIIRPAAFCGVVGFKPSHGLLSLAGVSPLAPSLDTLGVLVRRVEDLVPVVSALGARLPPPAAPDRPPRIGLCRTEAWSLAAVESRAAVEGAAAGLARAGAAVRDVDLGPAFAGLAEAQRTIMAAETARSLAGERREFAALLGSTLRAFVDEGAAIPVARYGAALALADACRRMLPSRLADVDVLLTPSASGEAPTIETTGDPAFNRVWTLLHLPCLNLPAGLGPRGLPVGVQIVGSPGGDAALLGFAAWIEAHLG